MKSKQKFCGISKLLIALLCIQGMLFFGVPVDCSVAVAKSDDSDTFVKTSADMNKIVIPNDFGKINQEYEGLEDQLIVHIQDVHVNYEAQKNISEILKVLVSQNGIEKICLEGAEGPFMLDKFHVFKDKFIRGKIADYFMKTGKLTGAEYLFYANELPGVLMGVENRDVFMANYRAFKEPLKFREAFGEYYDGIKSTLKDIKVSIYSSELMEIDRKETDLEKGEITLIEFCNYLKDVLISKGFVLKDYKNFSRMIMIKHVESGINFDLVDRERIGLLNLLGMRLDEEEVMDIRQVSIDYKNGRITSDDYYKYLKRLSDRKEIDISRFPNIAFYFKYLEMYGALDVAKLMKEKKELSHQLKEKLFTSDDQRYIDKISGDMDLINDLFSLRVSNDEFNAYTELKGTISAESVEKEIKDIAMKSGLPVDLPESFRFEDKFDTMDSFYGLAKDRNMHLFENTLSFMREDDSNTAVLISGGFHTRGMTEMMKDQDVSYMVVAPSVTQEHDYNEYISNMLGEGDIVDKLFTLSLPEESAIPPSLSGAARAFVTSRQQLLINSSVLLDVALEVSKIVNDNIDFTDKDRLTPEETQKVESLLGGQDYLNKISTSLGVTNIEVDYRNIRAEGGNKAVLMIPVKIFDLQFQVAVVDPKYDLSKTPSSMMGLLATEVAAVKEIPELDMTLFFEGTVTPQDELIAQDPFVALMRQRLLPAGEPELVWDIALAVEDTKEAEIPLYLLGTKVAVDPYGEPIGRIKSYDKEGIGDSVVFYNVNGKPLVGLTESFGLPDFKVFPVDPDLQVSLYTMTPYSPNLQAKIAFPGKIVQEDSLGKIVHDAGISQSRIAGKDQIDNVTVSIDGNISVAYDPDKHRIIEVESPPMDILNDIPEYNSAQIADQAIKRVTDSKDGLIVANFSAPALLGVAGNVINAANGIEKMDQQIESLVSKARDEGMTVVITGTHGNVEQMLDENGNVVEGRYSSHTTNPVPFVYIDPRDGRLKTQNDILKSGQSLGSIAPAILQILGLDVPESMTAPSLFNNFVPQQNNRVLFITIDGFGESDVVIGNAIALASQQAKQQKRILFFDRIQTEYPKTSLIASGANVGLRDGQAGYAESNYFAIGSGLASDDIVLDMVKVDQAIESGEFEQNTVFLDAINNAVSNGTKLHLFGMVSEAEKDASINHLEALLNLARNEGMKKEDVIIHTLTDGIDEASASVLENIRRVIRLTEDVGVGTLATVGSQYSVSSTDSAQVEKTYNALIDKQIKEQAEKTTGVVLIPSEMLDQSLGLREALTVIRQQYGAKIKVGVLTEGDVASVEKKLKVNNVSDKVDFVVSEKSFDAMESKAGIIDPILSFITNRYPDIENPSEQVAVITLDLDKLGVDAVNKAQIFVQEKPEGPNEVFSVANGLFAAVMTLDGHENDLVAYDGWVPGQPRTLRTIVVEKNFMDQLNRQRQINQIFETAA